MTLGSSSHRPCQVEADLMGQRQVLSPSSFPPLLAGWTDQQPSRHHPLYQMSVSHITLTQLSPRCVNGVNASYWWAGGTVHGSSNHQWMGVTGWMLTWWQCAEALWVVGRPQKRYTRACKGNKSLLPAPAKLFELWSFFYNKKCKSCDFKKLSGQLLGNQRWLYEERSQLVILLQEFWNSFPDNCIHIKKIKKRS